MHIDLLSAQTIRSQCAALCHLLIDSVHNGASVGFLPPLDAETAAAYWREVAAAVDAESRLLLAAEENGRLIGVVQLDLCMRKNGLHRAEVSKLLVDSTCRRRGIGRQLMQTLEAHARNRGRSTLFLDTRAGDPSELLYQKLGYTRSGLIPQYARSADGTLHTTAFYYRLLGED